MRRLTTRAFGLLAVALMAITCTDAPTGPGGSQGVPSRLGLAPTFSPTAARAYSALASIGVNVTSVHIVLTGVDGKSAADTTIDFPAGQDSLVVEIPLQIQGTEQSFTATLALLDAQNRVLFSHTQSVTARASNLPAAPTPTIRLEYVGPGHLARTMTLSPSSATVPPGGTQAITAAALDSAGRPLADLLVSDWTSSDTTLATVSATDSVTARVSATGRRGTVTITGKTPTGITATASLTMLPQPSRIVVVSGNAQSGTAGHALAQPVVLEVDGVDGLPITGVAVHMRATTFGGQVGDTLLTTDGSGRASTTLTLGRSAGSYSYEASTGTIVTVITATATPAPATTLTLVSGDAQTDSVGRTLALPLVVKATDEFNAPVSGAVITWARVGGAGSTSASSTTTDSAGLARVTYTLGTTVHVDSVRATIQGLTTAASTVLFTERAIARSANRLMWVSLPPDTVVVGSTQITATVRLADSLGNPVQHAGTWVKLHGNRIGAPASDAYVDSVQTDSTGSAFAQIGTYSGLAGQLSLTIAVTGLDSLNKQLVAVPGAASRLMFVQGPPASAQSGVPFAQAVIAQVTDVGGNAVPANASVTMSVQSPGSLGGTATRSTDASGRATFDSLSVSGPAGTYSLSASATGLQQAVSSPFTLAGGVGSQFTLLDPMDSTIVVGVVPSRALRVQLVDASGNVVHQGGVVATLTGTVSPANMSRSFTATTDSLGVATITLPMYVGPIGTMNFTVTAPGVSTLTPPSAPIRAGAPNQVMIVTQPASSATSGAAFSVQPVLAVADTGGNVVSTHGAIAVRAAALSGSVAMVGDSIITSDSTGRATFAALGMRGQSGSYQLEFTGGTLHGVVSNSVTLVAGAPVQLVALTGSGHGPAGELRSVSVRAVDASGNGVPLRTITWSVLSGGGSVTSTSQTDASGIAQASWQTGYSVGVQRLQAADLAATLTQVFEDTTSVPTGSRLVVVTQPAQPNGAVLGDTVAPQPQVQLRDSTGHNISLAGVTVAASIAAPASVAGETSVATDSMGLARFTGLILNGYPGDYRLLFSATGYGSDSSAVFHLASGAPAAVDSTYGSGQTAGAGSVLPFAVGLRVKDAHGNPVIGANVTFKALNAGAKVNGGAGLDTMVTVQSGSGGYAQVSWKLGTSVGTDSLRATVSGIATPVMFSATATVLPASQFVIISGAGQSDTVTRALAQQIVIESRDSLGNVVPNVPVEVNSLSFEDGHVQFTRGGLIDSTTSPEASTTDSLGRASFTWWMSDRAKVDSMYVENLDIAPTLVTATALMGGPSQIMFVRPAGGYDDDVGNILTPFNVFVSDIGGVDTVTTANSPITLHLVNRADCTCDVSTYLTGRLTVTPVNGVARFDSLTISHVGMYQLGAMAGTAAPYSGNSEDFDISSGAPHFIVAVPFPTDVPAGATIQVQLQSVSTRGDSVPNVPIVVSGDGGMFNFNGGTTFTSRDSSTTDASGRITLTWKMPSTPQSGLYAYVTNDSAPSPLYLYVNAVTGPPSRIVVTTDGTLDDDVGNILNGVSVQVADSAGNPVYGITGPVSVSLSGGDAGATLGGRLTMDLTDGQAYFDSLTIDRIGIGYQLTFTANNGAWVAKTAQFDISPQPTGATVASITSVEGTQLLLAPNTTHNISFVTKDSTGAPMRDQHVSVYVWASESNMCWFGTPDITSRTTFTDSLGVATLPLTYGPINGACHISASSGGFGTEVESVAYSGTATHVWFGNSGGQPGAFGVDSNWVRLADRQPSVPGATDHAFIPGGVSNSPNLQQNVSLASLTMENGGYLNLATDTMTVTGNVLAQSASIEGGTMVVSGAGSTVTGNITRLTLGKAGCASDNFTIHDVWSSVLTLQCSMSNGTSVSADSLIVVPGARLTMDGQSATLYASNAVINGAKLDLDGELYVSTNGVIAPDSLVMKPNARLDVMGDAQLGANAASVLQLAGSVYIGGALTELGTGTSTATITVVGNATFDGANFTLPSGELQLYGDLIVGNSSAFASMVASNDHLTRFVGSATQHYRNSYASYAPLARVSVENTTGGVIVDYDAVLAAGPDSLRLELLPNARFQTDGTTTVNGNAHVGANAFLNVTTNGVLNVTSPAWLRLFSGSIFTIDGQVHGGCTDTYLGVQATGLTINGTGQINGSTPSNTSCTAQ